MTTKPPILRVVVPSPLWQSFDYLLPEDEVAQKVCVGQRVKVPFGRRTMVGMIMELADKPQIDPNKLKAALAILDEAPLLPESILKLYRWASDYYHYPLGEVILGTLPTMLRQGKSLYGKKDKLLACADMEFSAPPALTLNADQENAYQTISQVKQFKAFALEGVTGSGKTEIYLRCIDDVLKAGKQALVLVPEIALTPQTEQRFRERFDVSVVTLHSNLSDGERRSAWVAAKEGRAGVVIGTRSAIFVPLKNPGMIILDEEHDTSFKQQAGFRYSARDLAMKRGQLENTPVVLGSATLSLETLFNVEHGRYEHLILHKRAGIAKPPNFRTIDLRQQQLHEGLSNELVRSIRQHLDASGQVMLFLNRRGFAPVLMCHHCGFVAECSRCDIRMTLHLSPRQLHCHHCGSARRAPTICESCEQAELFMVGLGTERLEHALIKLFPDKTVLRIDRDSTRKKGSLHDMLDLIHNDKADIMIGTQMLAKGHHFPNLTLVAIVDADGGLFSADFRATERMAQLIVQVSGRAGRADKMGEVLIQTHQPEHAMLQTLLRHGYAAFAKELLAERRQMGLPPYGYFALLRAESHDQSHSMNFLAEAKKTLCESAPKQVAILGPILAPMSKKAGRYRAQLLIQSKHRPSLQATLAPFAEKLAKYENAKRVRWSLDVDPQEMG